MDDPQFLFDVLTPLGFRVHVTTEWWETIVTVKHPSMSKHLLDVQEALQNPDEVRISKLDKNVFLFYKAKAEKRWVCGVSKQVDLSGYLITAYLTDAIKTGEKIWPK